MSRDLTQVIIDILKSSPEPLTARQITNSISKNKLWFRPKDGKSPDSTQVNARVNNYPEYFARKNGFIVLNIKEADNRLCKIVWNSNYWIKPMERAWNPSSIEDSNKGYEQKHGFVHEDWLFNAKFVFDGYQYGYIRGVSKLNESIKKIGTVYLFTINPNSKERFYVGKLYDVDCLQFDDVNKSVLKTIESFKKDMVLELKATGADYSAFKKDPFVPNLRFKVESKEIFPAPLAIQSNWFARKYFRTMPMKMDAKLYDLLNGLETQIVFGFAPSSPDNKKGGYTKHTKEGTTQVDKVHNEIEKALYSYLIQMGIKKSNIACDTTSFGGKLADVVVNFGNDVFEIYEIKTDTDLRRGLREAVGQLLDYATWEKGVKVRKIHAVLPSVALSSHTKDFIRRLQKNLHLNLEVLLYDNTEKTFLRIK